MEHIGDTSELHNPTENKYEKEELFNMIKINRYYKLYSVITDTDYIMHTVVELKHELSRLLLIAKIRSFRNGKSVSCQNLTLVELHHEFNILYVRKLCSKFSIDKDTEMLREMNQEQFTRLHLFVRILHTNVKPQEQGSNIRAYNLADNTDLTQEIKRLNIILEITNTWVFARQITFTLERIITHTINELTDILSILETVDKILDMGEHDDKDPDLFLVMPREELSTYLPTDTNV